MASKNSLPLPIVWRFDPSDYIGLGSVFQKFLANLNLFTIYTYNLLNGGIGFANLQRVVYTTSVLATSNTTLSFVNPLAITPSGVMLVQVYQTISPQTAITSAVSVSNWSFDGKSVNILSIPGLTSGTTYTISLEVC